MDRRSRGSAKLNDKGKVVSATCESVGCPYLADESMSKCRSCPGPDFFMENHSCHSCPLKRKNGKPDDRCLICLGPSDEPSHKGVSHVYLDDKKEGGQSILSKQLNTRISPASIDLPPEDEERSRNALRFFSEMDILTFSYVRDILKGGGFANLYDVNDGKKKALQKVESYDTGVERRVRDVFMAMTVDQFAIVKHLLAGGNLNTYACAYNSKRQYAWNKMRDLMTRCPEVRVIVKERKQPNGRVLKGRNRANANLLKKETGEK